MKKIYFLLVITFSLTSYNVDAQKLFGIRAGYQSAITKINGDQHQSNLNGFYLGLYRNNDWLPFLDWHSGLEYIQNGSYSNDDNYRRIHYISVPLGVRAKVGPVYGLGGFALNFRVGETYYVAGEDVTDDNKTNGFDLPFFLGVGFKIAIFHIDARYNWGLIDVREELGGDARNEYFQLGVGVQL